MDAGTPTTATRVAVGRLHSCAITSAGAVLCWGDNDRGQVGINVIDASSTGVRSTPVQVLGLTRGATEISSFGDATCAVVDGGAKCWGGNESGQIGNASTTDAPQPVNVNGLTSGVTTVSVGETHACALVGGTVRCWGANGSGQLGNNSMAAQSTTPVAVSNLTSVAAIAAGRTHTCARTSNNVMYCWGSNAYGELGLGMAGFGVRVPGVVPGLDAGVVAIAAGDDDTCAVLTGGSLRCWGKNNRGQVGNGVSGTFEEVHSPAQVVGVTSGTTEVSLGYEFTCAVISGAAKCWGSNFNLVLGNGQGASFESATPVDVTGLTTGAARLSATSSDHACALTTAGAVRCWGTGGGHLGSGDSQTDQATPGPVVGLP